MATKVSIVLVDELDGSADEMVSLGIGGAVYEMDLNAAKRGQDARRTRRLHRPWSQGPRCADYTAPR